MAMFPKPPDLQALIARLKFAKQLLENAGASPEPPKDATATTCQSVASS